MNMQPAAPSSETMVLIIEDNDTLAELIALGITDLGCRSATVSTGGQALEWLEHHQADLIILDYSLPDMKGAQLHETLAARDQAIPFVVITGHGDERVAVEMMKAGARDYLIKDATFLDRLPEVIGRTLRDITSERKLAHMELALKVSEKRYQQALEAVNDGLWEWNVKTGEILFASPRVLELRAYTAGEIIWDYATMFGHVHPDDQSHVMERLIDHVEGRRESYEAEYRSRTKHNHWIWILSRGRVVTWDNQGVPEVMIGTDTDITERKRTEEILQQSEERYRTLIESAPFPVIITRLSDSKILYLNTLAVKRFGVSRKDALGLQDTPFYANPAERDSIRQILRHEGSLMDYELCLQTQQGESFWAYLSAALITFGNQEAVFGAFNEVTARKLAEDKLRESEAKYRYLTEKMNDIVWTADLNLCSTYVSPSIEKVLGFTPEERLSQAPGQQITPASLTLLQHKLLEELERDQCGEGDPERSVTLEVEFIHKNGSTVWTENVVSAIRDEQGAMIGIHGVSRDISERKRVEEALRASEAKYRFLTEKMNDIIWTADLNLHVTYISPSFEKVMGYAPDDRMEMDLAKRVTPASFAHIMQRLAVELSNVRQSRGEPDRAVTMEVEFLHKDGSTVWTENVVSAIRDEAGKIVGIHGVTRDISERRLAQLTLKAQLEFTQTLLETIASPVFYKDATGVYLGCNRAFAEYQGRMTEEIVGCTVFDLAPPEYAGIYQEMDKQLLEQSGTQVYETKVRHYGLGQDRDVIFTKSVFKDARGQHGGIVGLMVDITDRKKNEEFIARAKQDWERTFDAVPDLISIIDSDHRIKRVNMAMANHLGRTPVQCLGELCYPLMHGTDAPPDFCPHAELIQTGQQTRAEFHDDTSGKDLLVTCSPLHDNVGTLTGCVHVVRDVTEQKQAEAREKEHVEQLMQADKMVALGTLVSGVAHEINNPNNFIMLNARIVSQAWADVVPVLEKQVAQAGDFSIAKIPYTQARDKITAFIDGIAEGSIRIKNIVQNLKDFSRPEKSDFKQNIDLNMVVKSAVDLLANLIGKKTLHFTTELGERLPYIYGNFQRLEQVVINLIQNACESLSGVDKAIAVRTYYDEQPRQVCIQIRDEGMGILKEHQKYIMNPFFTTKRDAGGTGLGLSIIARIVEDHGGSIAIQSEPSAGTTVIVAMPVRNA